MIRLPDKKFAEVTNSFIETSKDFIQTKVQHRRDTHRGIRPALERSAKKISVGAGVDKMKTELRRLKYTKFYSLVAPNGDLFVCGDTEDLILKIRGDKYNVGPYHVCISKYSFVKEQQKGIHLFPAYKPNTPYRHLHHKAYPPRSESEITNPLLARDDWCWHSVWGSYLSAVGDGDIVDCFRVLYLFITRLNWSSPLCSNWAWEAREYGERIDEN